MKNQKIRFVPVAAALVGLFAIAVPASAQTYQGDTVVQNVANPGNPTGNPDKGGYHITLLESNPTTFQITSITANSSNTSAITKIKVQFYNGAGGAPPPIAVLSNGAGGTAGNPWFFGVHGETFPGAANSYALFDTRNGANALAFGGVFSQTGTIGLAGNPSPVRSVLFTLTDVNNNSYTYFDYVNAPEAGSLLLLTVALLPFAFFLRRRAKQNTA